MQKAQITNVRNEKGDITTYSTDFKKVRSEYFEKLYASRFDDLG